MTKIRKWTLKIENNFVAHLKHNIAYQLYFNFFLRQKVYRMFGLVLLSEADTSTTCYKYSTCRCLKSTVLWSWHTNSVVIFVPLEGRDSVYL